MKKIIIAMLLVTFVLSAAFALDFAELDKETYVGVSMSQYHAEGFKDTTLFDNVAVKLNDANGNKLAYGAEAGARFALLDNAYVLVEVNADFASLKSFIVDVGVGGAYYFLNDVFHLGVGARVGYFYQVNQIATINFNYWGYDVNGKYFSGYKGDTISYDVMGIAARAYVDMEFDINTMFSIGAKVGYRYGFSFKDAVMVNSSNDTYGSVEYTTFTDQDPKVNPRGLTAAVFGVYKF